MGKIFKNNEILELNIPTIDSFASAIIPYQSVTYPRNNSYIPNPTYFPGQINNSLNFNNAKYHNEQPKLISRKVEKQKIKTRFQIKIDILFLTYCVLFGLVYDMMLGIANEPGNDEQLLMTLSILVSATLGIAMSAFFTRPLRVYISKIENKGLFSDMLSCLPYFALIIMTLLVSNYLIPLSRFNMDMDVFMSASFVVTNAFAEEMTFSLFLGMLLFATSKNKFQVTVQSVVICVIFALYHIFVYDNIYALIPLAVSRFFLNAMFIKTGRISIPIFYHLLNNIVYVLPMIIEAGGLMG